MQAGRTLQVEDPFSKWQMKGQIFEVKKAELLTTCLRCYNAQDLGVRHNTDIAESRQSCTPTFPLPEQQHFPSLNPCSDTPFAPLPGADEKPLGLPCGAGHGEVDWPKDQQGGR